MEKALKFLKHMKQTDTPYNFRECELDEAIIELEEAMKPKTCEGCRYASYDDECEEYYYSNDTYECRDCYRSGYKDNFMAKYNA